MQYRYFLIPTVNDSESNDITYEVLNIASLEEKILSKAMNYDILSTNKNERKAILKALLVASHENYSYYNAPYDLIVLPVIYDHIKKLGFDYKFTDLSKLYELLENYEVIVNHREVLNQAEVTQIDPELSDKPLAII
jgi:hypothetical protein